MVDVSEQVSFSLPEVRKVGKPCLRCIVGHIILSSKHLSHGGLSRADFGHVTRVPLEGRNAMRKLACCPPSHVILYREADGMESRRAFAPLIRNRITRCAGWEMEEDMTSASQCWDTSAANAGERGRRLQRTGDAECSALPGNRGEGNAKSGCLSISLKNQDARED